MDLYNEALKIWAVRQIGSDRFWAEDVLEVKFGEGNHGVCETCDDPYLSMDILTERSGKKKWHQIDIEHITPTEIVKECMEIYMTLSHQKKYIT